MTQLLYEDAGLFNLKDNNLMNKSKLFYQYLEDRLFWRQKRQRKATRELVRCRDYINKTKDIVEGRTSKNKQKIINQNCFFLSYKKMTFMHAILE